MARFRTFNSKRYEYIHGYSIKKLAQSAAKHIQGQGFYVRIVKVGKYYNVYARKKY